MIVDNKFNHDPKAREQAGQAFELNEALEQLEKSQVQLLKRERELEHMQRLVDEQRAELRKLRVTVRPLRWFVQSREWDGVSERSALAKLWRRSKKRIPQRAINLIKRSSLFDGDWYLQSYPQLQDDSLAKVNPAMHYLKVGGFERLNPGPHFDSYWYLCQYADVRDSGVNPLLHYLLHGEDEGRKIRAAGQSADTTHLGL